MTATAPMLDRPFAGDDELEELVSGFEDGTLPKPRWTHRAHLAVGLVYCDRMPAPVALALLRERIRRYNVASGGENTSTAGYHETITRFYIYIVRRFIAEDRGGGHPGGAGQPALPAVWRPQSAQTLLQRGPALLGGSPGPVDRSRPAAARLSGRAVTTVRGAAAAAS